MAEQRREAQRRKGPIRSGMERRREDVKVANYTRGPQRRQAERRSGADRRKH